MKAFKCGMSKSHGTLCLLTIKNTTMSNIFKFLKTLFIKFFNFIKIVLIKLRQFGKFLNNRYRISHNFLI